MGLLSTIGAASARAYGFTRSAIAAAVDAYFNRVTLLLPGNGTNGAQNNTFLDSSTNNFTITRNGNTTQGTFSPFSQTGWSNYFGGSSYLAFASNAAFTMGTGDFTYECWAYHTDITGQQTYFARTNGNFNGVYLYKDSSHYVGVYTTTQVITSNVTISANQWYHIAAVRSSGVLKLYINGVERASASFTTNLTESVCEIAGDSNGTSTLIGYVSNARITKGGALYTSAFTPSTTPLTTTVSAGTVSLLTCQSNRFVDNSTNAFAITVNGTPSVQAFSPFYPTVAYTPEVIGGGAYFDGSGDYLSIADNAAFAFGSGDFTIECWAYTQAWASQYNVLICQWNVGSAFIFRITNSLVGLYVNISGTQDKNVAVTNNLNTWNHFAVTRSGSTLTFYKNGSSIGTTAISGSINDPTDNLTVGILGDLNSTTAHTGYISGLRVIKGSAVAPTITAPPTAVTNTSLLLNFTNAGITDATAKNDLETVGNAQISTTQSKFGGASMSFDGSSTVPMPARQTLALGSGNWTIECWVRLGSTGTETTIGQSKNYYTAGFNGNFVFRVGTSNLWRSFDGQSSQATIDGTYSWSTGQWYHVAWVRNGSTVTVYRDGTSLGSTTDSKTLNDSANGITLGSSLNAYVDDLRITVGVARYTANFTAPTVAFPLS